jgi:hypothetical protein
MDSVILGGPNGVTEEEVINAATKVKDVIVFYTIVAG